ncbi:cobalamin-dependent protein [Actinomadura oligospora]|uniref:cobalamin-dependent protein n=1 Tax=Actinomadura oligospora TaxID=111804 RepID=UPI00047A3FAC|nr:cobalamin-dependent protein [Actinomadura oligospora]
MRIVLANLSRAPVDAPSPALGVLTSAAGGRYPPDDVEVLHANVDFRHWVAGQRSLTALHALTPAFVHRLARRIVAAAPDLVGFASTYRQNTASLATARRVKELNPAIRTVLGGTGCDGVEGARMHRDHPALDFVVRDVDETVFARLLTALDDGGDLASIPGLCWRDRDGIPHANPPSMAPLDIRTLRDAVSAGIRPNWNYLYGFPGENDTDCLAILEQFPALHHLTPPMGTSAHLHSAAEGGRGIGQDVAARIESAVGRWRSEHRNCRFVHWDTDDVVRLSNSRKRYAWREFTIDDPFGVAMFHLLSAPRGLPSLVRRLTAELGVNVTHDQVRRILGHWKTLGLVFHDGVRYVHVATLPGPSPFRAQR